MLNNFINQQLKIFVSNEDLYNNIKDLPYFNQSNFYVYTNSSYTYGFTQLYNLPENQKYDIIITDSTYIYNKLLENNILFDYIICEGTHIFLNIPHIDNYYGYYLYTKQSLIQKYIPIIDPYNIKYQQDLIISELNNTLQNMFIPIFIRTKDRPYYLYATLKSLTGSKIPNTKIHIIDDCSKTQIGKKFLYTNQKISESEFSFYNELNYNKDKQIWNNYIGKIQNLTNIYGIKDKFDIIKCQQNNGDLYGLLYTIKYAFELYPSTENIIILQDDILFNNDWLNIAKLIYSQIKKPFGYITLYKHPGYHHQQHLLVYQNVQLQSGLMSFISKDLYKTLINMHIYDNQFLNYETDYYLTNLYRSNTCSDLFLFNICKKFNLQTYTSKFSYIQHIGMKSSCTPNIKFNIRCANDFIQPFTWNWSF